MVFFFLLFATRGLRPLVCVTLLLLNTILIIRAPTAFTLVYWYYIYF